jgi:lipoate-protein ligase A
VGLAAVELVDDGLVGPAENEASDVRDLALGLPKVRVARISSPALSLGVGQSLSTGTARRARALGLPVFRRSTGGTGVLLGDGDVVWSVVLPRNDPRVVRDFVHAYAWFGRGVVRTLASFGVEATWGPALSLSEEFCFLGSRGCALTNQGRALGGAAQHATRTAILHHGILPLTIDRQRLEAVFGLAPAYSEPKLTTLLEVVPAVNPMSFVARLGDMIGDSLLELPLDADDLDAAPAGA